MTKIIRAISILLVTVLLFGAAPLGGFVGLELPDFSALFVTKAQAADPTSGTYGDNLTWRYNETTKTLTISGTGMMFDSIAIFNDPEGLTTAPWHVYYNSMVSLIIEDGVESIGSLAFSGCTGLRNITIPPTVTSIHWSAFDGCVGLTSVTIPNSVTRIDSLAFSDCTGLTSVMIGSGVTSLADSAFNYCSGLTNIKVASGNPVYHSAGNCLIKTANKELVLGCKTSVIPSDGSVTSIGYSAFYGCTGLMSITIQDGVTSIGGSAFFGCTSLTSITIPDSVTSIGYGAFSGCKGLTSITVASGNPVYCSAGNCLIQTTNKKLVLGCRTSVMPSDGSVTSIGDSAFSGCTGLTSVTIPDSVTSIGDSAFFGCTGLTSVTIPDSVTSIGDEAFCYCRALTRITIPDSVTSIGYYAFSDCTGLMSATIQARVAYILTGTFSDCTGLTIVSIPNSVTSINMYAFDNCDALADVYYQGTEDEWNAIRISTDNDALVNARKHYLDSMGMEEVLEPQTGIWLQFDGTQNSGRISLEAERVTAGEDYSFAASLLGTKSLAMFDIKLLKDGLETQPNGKIKVKIPLPEGYDPTRTFVYHVNTETGAVEKMNATYEPPYMVFETDHFSYYAIVEEAPAAQPTITIKNFTATKPVDYKTTITFTAVSENAPDDATVHWFIDGKDVGTGEQYTKDKATASYTVQCKLMQGNTVLAESEIENVQVNTGFFAKLIAFFKGLFGSLPIITQAIKETM